MIVYYVMWNESGDYGQRIDIGLRDAIAQAIETRNSEASAAVTGQYPIPVFVLRTLNDTPQHLISLEGVAQKRAFHSSAPTAKNGSRYSLADGLEHAE